MIFLVMIVVIFVCFVMSYNKKGVVDWEIFKSWVSGIVIGVVVGVVVVFNLWFDVL